MISAGAEHIELHLVHAFSFETITIASFPFFRVMYQNVGVENVKAFIALFCGMKDVVIGRERTAYNIVDKKFYLGGLSEDASFVKFV